MIASCALLVFAAGVGVGLGVRDGNTMVVIGFGFVGLVAYLALGAFFVRGSR